MRPSTRRLLSALAALVVIGLVTPVASASVMLAAYLFLPLPAELPERTPPSPSQISRVYDVSGNEIATFKQFETSIPVEPGDIPQGLKDAVVAAEDRNFYRHSGVDVRATLRALWADIRNRDVVQGGSTITQQLVKNTVTGSEVSLSRKIREAVLASQLDRKMDKDEILFEYLSVIYLGEGAYGVGAAAETYFRKPVSDLSLSEAALLAGVIPAPSRYSPRVDPGAADIRRRHVLDVMLGEGMITEEDHAAATAETVWLATDGAPPGPATVVQPAERQQSIQPYFSDYVYRWLAAHLPGGEEEIYQGLRIETTLDPGAQEAAERQVAAYLEGSAPDLRMSLVAVEPPTGYVRAFVSGRDFTADAVNYALGGGSQGGVSGAGSGRQPGSAFKPFVLAEALRQGVSPDTTYSGAPLQIGDDVIENYGGARYGTMTLRSGTHSSVNGVYARLILDVGVEPAMDLARAMGLTTVRDYDASVHGAAVALGTESVSPLDMAAAYGVFAARGLKAEASPVLRVTDRDGNVLIDNTDPRTTRVLDEDVADNVTAILQGVITNGTARGRDIGRPAAGKTGTTNENVDAWFAGYTPTLSTAVWLGYKNESAETVQRLPGTTGGSGAAPVWQRFMRDALRDVPVTEFNEPAPIRTVADEAKRRARGGFEPGQVQRPAPTDGGPYVVGLDPPQADPPPVVPDPTSSTTSSTVQGRRSGGDDGPR